MARAILMVIVSNNRALRGLLHLSLVKLDFRSGVISGVIFKNTIISAKKKWLRHQMNIQRLNIVKHRNITVTLRGKAPRESQTGSIPKETNGFWKAYLSFLFLSPPACFFFFQSKGRDRYPMIHTTSRWTMVKLVQMEVAL